MNRKKFLQLSSLASTTLLMPKFLKAWETNTALNTDKVLIIIQLTGGNDGLNTIIPITNDIYYGTRNSLAIPKSNALTLTTDAGINPNLSFIKKMYDAGNVAILNNVGYPVPDKSHFRSMDIWHTASNSNEYLQTGWLGRYLDEVCYTDCNHATQALEIDDMLSLALKGTKHKAIAFKDANRLLKTSSNPYFKKLQESHTHTHQTADYLYQTLQTTTSNAAYIAQQAKTYSGKVTYPNTAFAKDLRTIASLIQSNINTRVYYASLGSFDTHINQQNRQHQLFKTLNDALESFVTDLKQANVFENTLIVTFSEFGRRVAQNASNGTDHGTANNMFFIGGNIQKPGLLNDLPNLNNLQDGDLIYTEDFRDVYATLLKKWLLVDEKKILGAKRKLYDFI